MSTTVTVRELCARYGVAEHTVLGWIRSGELKALNVGRTAGTKKPRWRITAEALATFELLRSHTPPSNAKRRRRRKDDGVIHFY